MGREQINDHLTHLVITLQTEFIDEAKSVEQFR